MTNRATLAANTLRHSITPAVRYAEDRLTPQLQDQEPPPTHGALARRVLACSRAADALADRIDWAATNLAQQRATAAAGRPRGGTQPGSRSSRGTSSTEATATEMLRITDLGMDLQEAIDRIHPDPAWPTITSGRRQRTTTATEHLAAMAADAIGTLNPAQAHDDLADAIDGLEAAISDARRLANLATKIKAWAKPGKDEDDIDPPPPIEEFARCTGWPKGRDTNGVLIGCEQYIGSHGHRHPNGSEHHHDLCDDCYRMLCPGCWNAPRRTKGASWCHACAKRLERAGQRLGDLEAIAEAAKPKPAPVRPAGPIRNVARPDPSPALG